MIYTSLKFYKELHSWKGWTPFGRSICSFRVHRFLAFSNFHGDESESWIRLERKRLLITRYELVAFWKISLTTSKVEA